MQLEPFGFRLKPRSDHTAETSTADTACGCPEVRNCSARERRRFSHFLSLRVVHEWFAELAKSVVMTEPFLRALLASRYQPFMDSDHFFERLRNWGATHSSDRYPMATWPTRGHSQLPPSCLLPKREASVFSSFHVGLCLQRETTALELPLSMHQNTMKHQFCRKVGLSSQGRTHWVLKEAISAEDHVVIIDDIVRTDAAFSVSSSKTTILVL